MGRGFPGATAKFSVVPRVRFRIFATVVKRRSRTEYQARILAKKSTAVKILVSFIFGEVEEESYLAAAEWIMSFHGNPRAYASHWESVLRKLSVVQPDRLPLAGLPVLALFFWRRVLKAKRRKTARLSYAWPLPVRLSSTFIVGCWSQIHLDVGAGFLICELDESL